MPGFWASKAGMIWATSAGYLIWGEIPPLTTWAGATLIVASGLFILYRETATGKLR